MLKHPSHDSRLRVVQRYRRTTLLAFVILGLALGATAWAWRSNRLQSREHAKTRLQKEIDRTRANIRTRLVVYEDALYGTRSLFQADRSVSRTTFRDYVKNLKIEERYPGIQGIGFAEYVPKHELSTHTRGVRKEGFPGYMIRPRGERSEYTSIIYLEPFDWRNRRAFGYDMFSDPIRRKAMERARDTGAVAMTSKVTLVQETDRNVQAGFLMYLPLYRRDVPQTTVEERRAALLGYIYSPFRLGDLMGEIPHEKSSLADFEIYSGRSTSPDALMYREPRIPTRDANYSPSLQQLTEIDFGGQIWTVRFSTSPSFDAIVKEGESRFLLPAGTAIAFLLFAIVISVAQTQRRAVRLADAITTKLRESEERVRAITETATDAIISANAQGDIVYFNHSAERIFGYPAHEVVGKSVVMLMSATFQEAHARSFERFVRKSKDRVPAEPVEMTGRRSDGTEFPLSVSLSTWRTTEIFYTAIARDITTSKLAEQNIMKLNQELTDALFRSENLAVTGRLMATIAHEINNPLTALTNLLFVLQSDTLTRGSRQLVEQAQQQVATLTNISRQTLAPYRETRFPTVTNLSELLDDVLSMLRPKLFASKVHVVRRYPAFIEVKIYPSELRQVFTNLIANSIDAMPAGGRLTVTVISQDGKIAIEIADTGTGIAPELQSKLFEPFFTTKGRNGTGLGLWVVQEIMKRIGGDIAMTSSTDEQSHGTRFTVVVPASAEARSKDEQPIERSA